MSDVLRAHAAEYLATCGGSAPLHVRSTLAQVTACYTAALGGHVWQCDHCGGQRVAYNGCRNRHCPGCGGAKRAAWLERLAAALLPVPHFQVVFTVPHELSRLMLANRRELYGLLFRAAWETLRDLAADPKHLGAEIGAVLVLHTWGQNLEHHPHMHCVVPGGGLSPDGQRWIGSRAPQFLLPVKVLGSLFRGKFLAGLRDLWRAGRLKLEGKLASLADERNFPTFLSTLYGQNWVVFSQPPPRSLDPTNATPLLKYLARYISGAAISDVRLLAHADGQVTFRAKNYRQGRKRVKLTLSGVEFTRRWALHILPRGFPRARHYGLLSNRGGRLARCRELLSPTVRIAPAAPAPPAVTLPSADTSLILLPMAAAVPELPRCVRCGEARWKCASLPRPRLWDVLMRSGLAPASAAAVAAPSQEDSS